MGNTLLSKKMDRNNSAGMLIDAEDVPNECFVQIFHKLDKKTLLSCLLTCRRFEKLISSNSYFVEHAYLTKKSDVLPSLAWRRAAAQKTFAGNEDGAIDVSEFNFNIKQMVISGRGYSPITPLPISSFTNARNNIIRGVLRTNDFSIHANANGIQLELDGGHGCQHHPDVSKCLTFSYTASSITVFIDLINSGIDAWVLDYVRPKIRISQKANHRHDCAANLLFAAQLNYHEDQGIQHLDNRRMVGNINRRYKSIRKQWEQWTENEWEDWVIELEDYPSGIRYLTVLNDGNDGLFWEGFYGPKIANLQIEVILPEVPTVKAIAPEILAERSGVYELPRVSPNRYIMRIPPAIAREAVENEEDRM